MKKKLFSLMAVLVIAAVSQAYWPTDTNDFPISIGSAIGPAAYVVGATEAAVSGSIAIGDGDGVAYVNGVTNAIQIGAGANTKASSIKYRSRYLPQVIIDTNATTSVETYTPIHEGMILVGNTGGTNAVWISAGSTTNDWVSVGGP